MSIKSYYWVVWICCLKILLFSVDPLEDGYSRSGGRYQRCRWGLSSLLGTDLRPTNPPGFFWQFKKWKDVSQVNAFFNLVACLFHGRWTFWKIWKIVELPLFCNLNCQNVKPIVNSVKPVIHSASLVGINSTREVKSVRHVGVNWATNGTYHWRRFWKS